MAREDFGTIVQIGDVLISEEVVTEFFACDYEACRGKCCIVGDSGAPLLEEELGSIERNYSRYSDLMQPKGRAAVDAKGFFDIDRDGDLVTPLCEGSEECAYCFFEGAGNCFCSMERRWFEGKCDFRKPISCQLYPIRVTKMPGGGEALNFHRWDICKDAFAKGKREGIRVYQFLKDPIVRQGGEEFYDMLCAAARKINSEE